MPFPPARSPEAARAGLHAPLLDAATRHADDRAVAATRPADDRADAATRHADAATRHADAATRHADAATRHADGGTRHADGATRRADGGTRHVDGRAAWHAGDGVWGAATPTAPTSLAAKDRAHLYLLTQPQYRRGLAASLASGSGGHICGTGMRMLETALGADAPRLPHVAIRLLATSERLAKRVGKSHAHSFVDNEFILPELASDPAARRRHAGGMLACGGAVTGGYAVLWGLAHGYARGGVAPAALVLGSAVVRGGQGYAGALLSGYYDCYKLHCDAPRAQWLQRQAHRLVIANEGILGIAGQQLGTAIWAALSLGGRSDGRLAHDGSAWLAAGALACGIPSLYFLAVWRGEPDAPPDAAARAWLQAAGRRGIPDVAAQAQPPPLSWAAKLAAYAALLREPAYGTALRATLTARLGQQLVSTGLQLMATVVARDDQRLSVVALALLLDANTWASHFAKRPQNQMIDNAFMVGARAPRPQSQASYARGVATCGAIDAGCSAALLGLAAAYWGGAMSAATQVAGATVLRGALGYNHGYRSGFWNCYRLRCGNAAQQGMQHALEHSAGGAEEFIYELVDVALDLAFVGLALLPMDDAARARWALSALAAGTLLTALPVHFFARAGWGATAAGDDDDDDDDNDDDGDDSTAAALASGSRPAAVPAGSVDWIRGNDMDV